MGVQKSLELLMVFCRTLKRFHDVDTLSNRELEQAATYLMTEAIIWGYIIHIKPSISAQNRVKKILSNFCVFFPIDGDLLDYYFDFPAKKMLRFAQQIPEYKHNKSFNFQDLFVPTLESVRLFYLLNLHTGS